MSGHRPQHVSPIFPWFAQRMTDDDWTGVRVIEAQGFTFQAHATSPHGPFTARAVDVSRGHVLAGVGSSPAEAISRLEAKVAEVPV